MGVIRRERFGEVNTQSNVFKAYSQCHLQNDFLQISQYLHYLVLIQVWSLIIRKLS